METKQMQLPVDLFVSMRDAIRAAEKDSRRDDRALHDKTRDLLTDANDKLNDWQDRKATGGRR